MSASNVIYRSLGRDGPKVSALGFGAMGISAYYGEALPQEEGQEIIRMAVDEGCTFIDTSIVYGRTMGDNERLLGTLLQDSTFRSKVFICTKFGIHFDSAGNSGISGKPEDVRRWCEESLRNLQIDTIDLYYQHRVDPTVPIEETWGEMKKLKEEGKVRYLGISEATAEQIRRAHAVTPISALQVEFSPWTPDIRTNGILSTCRELGISIVAYSPLARGMLTGTFTRPEDLPENDWRRQNPRFQGENFYQNLKLIEKVKGLAEKKGCTPGQLSIAWVLAQGEDFVTIPGTKRKEFLRENVGSRDVKLSEEEINEIDEIVNGFKASGARYQGNVPIGF